jgi:hypothetical protein
VLGNQGFVDHLEVGRGHDVGRFAQFGNHAGHLGAAAGLAQDIDAGVGRFETLFRSGQRHRQAAGVKMMTFSAAVAALTEKTSTMAIRIAGTGVLKWTGASIFLLLTGLLAIRVRRSNCHQLKNTFRGVKLFWVIFH